MNCVTEWIENGETNACYRETASLTHPLAPIALRFWENRPADGIVIGRDIPSRAIATLLSHVVIYQPDEGRRDLRVHLSGTALRARFARDITGLMMSNLFGPDDFPVRFNTMMDVIDRDITRMACITHTVGDIEVFRLELLMLPVWSPDLRERWAAAFAFYF
jgi:hypothetical protein